MRWCWPWRRAADSPLARLLVSFGATLRRVTIEELPALIPQAYFLIERLGLPQLESAGLSRASIETLNPRLIHVSVTTFGSLGPRAQWSGSELIASAMGGTLILTGDPDRPPVKEALDACFFHADMVAASGAMSAHYERGASGLGQHVDVAAQEVAFSRCINSVLVWQFDRRKLQRVGGALNYGLATVRCIWPLRDGWCFHTLMTGRFGAPANQGLSDLDRCGWTGQSPARRRLVAVQPLDPARRDTRRMGTGDRRFFCLPQQARNRHRRTAPRHQRDRGVRAVRCLGR